MKKRRGKGQDRREPDAAPGGASPPPADPAPSRPALARRLYTRCPGCQTVYRITPAQLRAGRGQAECQHCQTRFDALETLAETPARAGGPTPRGGPALLGRLDAAAPPTGAEPPAAARFEVGEEASPPRGRRAWWGGGAALLAALLAAQLGASTGPRWAQDERLRPALESACRLLGCRPPPFRAPGRVQILGHALRPAPGGADGYEFSLVLANQAPLPQAFPAVKLTLEAADGSPAAARVFQPADYLPPGAPALMPVGELQEIRLLLAKPAREAAGFSFELL